ncbi:ABC transporter, ATP-binding protein [Leptospira inadai serovar Lyme str. 10]|uniref:ABC transporter, ATP-binding protein n=2 Tax=Leptospira inadai serovar Lyme TaxID=293084 RepID=V6HAH0_9LEPT|nr:ABC transporter ATP-binding protein [Leptospira inadai]EQA35373.1 ABC transporter, ATP-binding protein [Leptospira inadai serovar Lyme str. 10]PNV76063.1 ABC transporter permease [Leptospira inadai serovar Lyme]
MTNKQKFKDGFRLGKNPATFPNNPTNAPKAPPGSQAARGSYSSSLGPNLVSGDLSQDSPLLILRGLARFFRKYKLRLVVVLGLLLVEILVYSTIPFSFKFLIDEAIIGKNQTVLYITGILLVGGTILITAVGTVRDYLYNWVSARAIRDMREELFLHLQRVSLDFYGNARMGDILSRFSSDLSALENAVLAAIPWGISPILEAIFGTALLFALDWRLGAIATLTWPVTFLGPIFFSKRSTQASYDRKGEEAKVLNAVEESVSAQNLIRVYDLDKLFWERFRGNCDRLFNVSLRLGLTNSYLERSASGGILMLQAVLLISGAWFAFHGLVSVGSLAAFLPPFLNLSYSLLYVSQYFPTLNQASGSAKRILEILRTPVFEQDLNRSVSPSEFRNMIRLEDVHFRYKGRNKNLNGVDLEIPKGSYTIILGPSGSGKSTIFKMLLGIIEPNQGNVTLDGLDMDKIHRPALHSLIGIVFQDTFLFHTSILENIRMGCPNASAEEAIEAAKLAEIHEFISSLPDGYETVVGDKGTRLSGGEKQRIALARAMVRNPQILLLDEATSALDPVTEARILKTLQKLREGRTIVSVTHRLTGLHAADQVLVMKNGILEPYHSSEGEAAPIPAIGL